MDIKKNTSAQKELVQAELSTPARHRIWAGTYAFLAIGLLVVYFMLKLHVFPAFGIPPVTLLKFLLAASFACMVLMLSKLSESIILKKAHSKAAKYNAARFIRLVAVLIICFIFISFLFQNWYTAAVSLGLVSLLLGFALQTPISSFAGWLYIIIRNPYHVGDRIQVNDFTGDVVEIGYLDTTLWEFAGDYLTNDMPSGRLIRFPNSLVFSAAVYNYSWKNFPFIWNEIPFHIAYESDFAYVSATLKKTANEILGPETAERINHLKALIKETPVDELEIKEYPYVSFRTNSNTWVEATISYLVPPKQATAIRSRILTEAVKALLQEPDKVMFPKSNTR